MHVPYVRMCSLAVCSVNVYVQLSPKALPLAFQLRPLQIEWLFIGLPSQKNWVGR